MTSKSDSQRQDERRNIPRTDQLLALPEAQAAREKLAEHAVRAVIRGVVKQAQRGVIAPADVTAKVRDALNNASPYSLRPVLNATGVIVHTNLGRAPLPEVAIAALADAAAYTDVELDLPAGVRSKDRGRGAINALLAACPGAEDALVVNNGAAALLLATAALAPGKEVIISRGELIEIGAGFRLPELIESSGTALKEIGATNRTHLADYEAALGNNTGAVLKVHPSNFRIEGFTTAVDVPQLRGVLQKHNKSRGEGEGQVSLIVDLGSGLLVPDPTLPEEPSLKEQLDAGADVVIASGDKLLGGPQAGIILGTKKAIALLKKHPLARAVRIDKLRLNALEAALNAPANAVEEALHIDSAEYRRRTEEVAQAVGGEVVAHAGRVGGGGAPEYPLEGFAVALPEKLAALLRVGQSAVLPRVHQGQCLIDVRCIPASQDAALIAAIRKAQELQPEE
ncbi:L-seryl-tRNA(Sec) selenium transferase [Corynebacterium accolens]|uniref:L-seryl-tRNA(Sec) selenium transferase n=1 Tax=Corynebacterium accolens TaxID=38284 RepID=A0A2A4ALQ5_9CORY|nr:L-seryl-tRNA(Sec) selenium transferase [Corynebacterium accolens]